MRIFFLTIFLSCYLLGAVGSLPKAMAQGSVGSTTTECNDGNDNDGDGKRDFGSGATFDPDCSSTSDNSESIPGQQSGSSAADSVKIDIKLKNPLGETDTIPKLIKKIMDAILTVAIPFIVLFFIYAGFLFVTARGNKETIEKAKRMFWYTLIGALLILGAWTIASAIVTTVNEITG